MLEAEFRWHFNEVMVNHYKGEQIMTAEINTYRFQIFSPDSEWLSLCQHSDNMSTFSLVVYKIKVF